MTQKVQESQEAFDKVIHGCLSPKPIKHPGTGEEMLVPCNSCKYCRQMRGNNMADRIEREFLSCDGDIMFITLKYDNEHLPVYTRRVSSDPLDDGQIFWYSNRDYDSIIDSYNERLKEYDSICAKAESDYELSRVRWRAEKMRSVARREKRDIMDDYKRRFIDLDKERKAFKRSFGSYKAYLSGRYNRLKDEEVYEFYRPVNYPGKDQCFGHLCYADVFRWLTDVRRNLNAYFSKRIYRKEIDQYFESYTYEDVQFRYYLCGEYGPTTFRPHYHLIVWFPRHYTPEQRAFISEVLSEGWKMGSIDIQTDVTSGTSRYVAQYVTSFAGLPEVLQKKHLRPFCTFSKSPTIGSKTFGNEKIQKALFAGVIEDYKWDYDKQSFVADVPPLEILRKYFPKCRGFGYRDSSEKLRVYNFVFSYFVSQGIEHSVEDLDNIRLVDIPFSVRKLSESEVFELKMRRALKYDGLSLTDSLARPKYPNLDLPWLVDIPLGTNIFEKDGDYYEDWSYTDKYASFVAYRYWIMFGITPAVLLDSLNSIYANLRMKNLRILYTLQEHKKLAGESIMDTLVHDMDFLQSLPKRLDNLAEWQKFALESYGVDIDDLYSEFDEDTGEIIICDDYFLPIISNYERMENYHTLAIEQRYKQQVKTKKLNEYKENLRSNKRYNDGTLPLPYQAPF